MEDKRDGGNWSDHKTLPLSEQGTLCVTGPNQVRAVTPCLLLNVMLPASMRTKARETKNPRC